MSHLEGLGTNLMYYDIMMHTDMQLQECVVSASQVLWSFVGVQ